MVVQARKHIETAGAEKKGEYGAKKSGSLGLSGVKISATAENAECAEKIYKNSAFSACSAVKGCSHPTQHQRTRKASSKIKNSRAAPGVFDFPTDIGRLRGKEKETEHFVVIRVLEAHRHRAFQLCAGIETELVGFGMVFELNIHRKMVGQSHQAF